MKLNISTKKHPLISLLKTAFLFSVISLLILSLTRLGVLALIVDANNIQDGELGDLLFIGLRFDLKIIASILLVVLCLPALVFAVLDRWFLFSYWVRASLLSMIVVLLLLSFLDFGFYMYFGTPIDSLVYGIIEDGTSEVISSIFGDWRLIQIIALCVLSIVLLGYWFVNKTQASNARMDSYGARIKNVLFVLLVSLLMLLPARGSLDTFPLSRKTVSISDDSLTNSLMFNGPYHLYYTMIDREDDNFRKLSSQKLLNNSDIQSFEDLIKSAGFMNENSYKKRSSVKPEELQKPHVIFVLMESWSSHIALMDSPDNNVLGELSKHVQDDHFFPYFYSNAYGTNPTIDSLLMNSPITPMSQSAAIGYSFSMSNVLPFKRQGYDTLYLSGSSSGWRNHNNFWPSQGFDRYLGRATIESHYGVQSDNPWGVYESYLFEYMKKTLLEAEENSNPLFSFVMTTNNHPPIRLPADYQAPSFNMKKFGFTGEDAGKREILSGFHYQTNALGQFLSWLKQSPLKDKVIVVATGDHIYKGFVNYTGPDMMYLRYSVPAYFYVPERYDRLKNISSEMPGSHEDLFPTLYELALSNSEYMAFGTPIMNKEIDSAYGWINRGSYLFNTGVATEQGFYPWKDEAKMKLSLQPLEISDQQKETIRQQKYRMLLRKYLLVSEFEQAAK